MTIDTLAYAKALEAAGVERHAAEAHAEALIGHILPELAGKADLDRAVERLERRIEQAVDGAAHQLTVRLVGFTLAIVGLMNSILFALSRVVPPPH